METPKIIEHRCIQVCRLRSYCIKHDYFCRGTNEEYEAMFDLIREGRGHDLTTETLYQVAKAIYDHSDWTHFDDVDVTDVMAGLAKDVCEYYFEYAEDADEEEC
jgi:hypothetical protein